MKKALLVIGVVLGALFSFNLNVYAKESNSCKTIDGAYYDKAGNETDKGTYEKECVSHSCDLVADAYFGKNGNQVSKEVFESECGITVYESFPDTASDSTKATLFILLGLSIIGSTVLVVRKLKED